MTGWGGESFGDVMTEYPCLPSPRVGGSGVVFCLTGVLMTGGAGVPGDALHFPGTSLISSKAISPR